MCVFLRMLIIFMPSPKGNDHYNDLTSIRLEADRQLLKNLPESSAH